MRAATENFWDTLPREAVEEMKDGLNPFRGVMWALAFDAILAIIAILWLVTR